METIDLPNGNFSLKIRARPENELHVSSGDKMGTTAESRRLSYDAKLTQQEQAQVYVPLIKVHPPHLSYRAFDVVAQPQLGWENNFDVSLENNFVDLAYNNFDDEIELHPPNFQEANLIL